VELIDLVALQPVQLSVGTIQANTLFRATKLEAQKFVASGLAVPADQNPALHWRGLNWDGADVVILASGPSLSVEQCAAVQAWRAAEKYHMRRVIAINTTYRRAPFADVIYACDYPWWNVYFDDVSAKCLGEKWTQDPEAAAKYGLHLIKSKRGEGLCTEPGLIYQGENSGYQAIGLCHQARAKLVYLLGYDMKGGHWHGDHPPGLDKVNRFERWANFFVPLQKDCNVAGMYVTNCTPGSALKAFPMLDWKEVFK
jgi:hypothetical protein